ncbi:cytochrome b/b6 domain-containing protein [Thermithiobacillus plumbiphilus]|uniref:Cytochrome b/b6 domain-containing protein n=1 Tax=Thermithiobacillus plumbiphilus TaxID=1729899 RepID=A0ABU9D6F9_9PROT
MKAAEKDLHYRLYPVWDPLLRLLHWWIAFTLLAQFISGSILLILGDSMSDQLMESFDLVHIYTGYALAAGLALRLVWLFAGPAEARWRDLLPLTARQRRVWRQTLSCYLSGFRRPVEPYRGHNAFAAPAYLAFYGIAAAQVTLGLILSRMSDDERMNSVLMNWHDWGFYLLLGFAVIHILMVVMHEIKGRHNMVSAMIHGHKAFTEAETRQMNDSASAGADAATRTARKP